MIGEGIGTFAGRRVLLLQGPVGPFFARLTADLRAAGAFVHKINFNAGDWWFYRRNCDNYRGTLEDWPDWLSGRIHALRIDTILLFGDCRPMHQQARDVAGRLGVDIGVFEEGYVRPDYITLERFGVNGYSTLPRSPEAYGEPSGGSLSMHPVGNTYWQMAGCALLYFTVAWFGQRAFPHYQHHRPIEAAELLPWVRSAWRKAYYRHKERGVLRRLTSQFHERYFLVPLQVFNDAQIEVHGGGHSIEAFIENTLDSFARHAPEGALLVFKHHPMDRGHRDYTGFITQAADARDIARRVLYIHDQHLPTLLQHSAGIVVINSTTGISALHHGRPTFVWGSALYDMPGLTFQGNLGDFWAAAPAHRPDPAFYRRYLHYLVATTQLNGSFYKRLPQALTMSGIAWPSRPRPVRIAGDTVAPTPAAEPRPKSTGAPIAQPAEA